MVTDFLIDAALSALAGAIDLSVDAVRDAVDAAADRSDLFVLAVVDRDAFCESVGFADFGREPALFMTFQVCDGKRKQEAGAWQRPLFRRCSFLTLLKLFL